MRDDLVSRRSLLGAGLAVCLPGVAGRAGILDDKARGVLKFSIKETAGLRRFGYPVHVILPIEPNARSFRLERNGQAVPAQFRPGVGSDEKLAVLLDFIASPGPFEHQAYVVRYGGNVEPGPASRGGMTVERREDSWIVRNQSALAYKVPDPFNGLLRSVMNGGFEYIDPRTPLVGAAPAILPSTRALAAKQKPLPSLPGVVTRKGPFAVGLRFRKATMYEGFGFIRSVVDLSFPSSKSWVEVIWTIDDPAGLAAGMRLDLDLQLEGAPIAVDFGANNTVYGNLRLDESMTLNAGEAPGIAPLEHTWQVVKHHQGKPELYAASLLKNAPAAEGWVHVMDKTRCTAVAIADFGRSTRDAIIVNGKRLTLSRMFAAPDAEPLKGTKTLRCWFHFVANPVQITAVTSPQAMLAPLEIQWKPPAE